MTPLAELEPMLAHAEPEQRRRAVKELVALRAPGVVPLFVRALGDEDWRVRKEASSLTPRVEPKDELVQALAHALSDRENIGLRNAAVEALVSLGPDAVLPVLAAIEQLDGDGRKLAVEVLAGVPDPRGVTRLVGALRDADANVVIAAAEALGKAGLASEAARKHATHALVSCLDAADIGLVLAALESLVRLDARLPSTRILPLAKHPLLRRVALTAAAHSREEPVLGVLVEATASAPPSVAREATVALAGWLRESAPEAPLAARASGLLRTLPGVHEGLRKAAAEPDDEHRAAALLLLGAVRDQADLPVLVAALDDEATGDAASRGLELFGPSAAPGLAALLEVADTAARATLLDLIASICSALEPRTLRLVRDCLADPSSDVVASAANTLASFGDEADLGRLISLAGHGDARVAEAATSAVHKLATRHPQAARALLAALDPTAEHAAAGAAIVSALAHTRAEAARESGRAGAKKSDSGVSGELAAFGERALRSVDSRARRLAVEALAASADPQAQEKVARALSDEERDVRLSAVRALGALGAGDRLKLIVKESTDEETISVALRALADASLGSALAVARDLVRGPDAALASTAVEVLARDGGNQREEGLLLALAHPDKDVVTLALSELDPGSGGTVSETVMNRLAGCLAHPAWEVRRLASELLGRDRSPAARAMLHARLELELEPQVREALTEALSIRPPRFEPGGAG